MSQTLRCERCLTILPSAFLSTPSPLPEIFSRHTAVLPLSATPNWNASCSTRCPLPPPPPLLVFASCFFTLFFLAFIFFLLYHLFNPHNEPFLLYLLLLFIYLPHWPFCSLALCQSLCEFYANHCARIEALRRQLQEEQRGRQVEHTATAGPGWYCSWDIL